MTGDVRLQPRWDIRLDGAQYVVELGKVSLMAGAPRRFVANGVEHSLGGVIHRGPRVATFGIAGRDARVTMRVLAPAFRAAYRRSLKGVVGSWWRLPLTILGYVFGGAAVGGGLAGANAASGMVSWSIYDLEVGGEHKGSWVLKHVGETAPSWTFVKPGAPLPERDWLDWPAPRK